MKHAIMTSYVGPTNTRGSRIIAKTSNGFRLLKPYDSALTSWDNHRHAALLLAIKLGYAEAETPDSWRFCAGNTKEGYSFVTVSA